MRSRECRDGQVGEGACNGDQTETESCQAECPGTCSSRHVYIPNHSYIINSVTWSGVDYTMILNVVQS